MKHLKSIILSACISISLSATLTGVSYAEDAKPAAGDGAKAVAPANGFLQQLNEGFTSIYDKAAPSVVVIDTVKTASPDDEDSMGGLDFFFRGPQGQADPRLKMPQTRKSEGSGFIVRADGYIFTNNHVIEDAEKINVRLKDGRHFTAKVIGADELSDIAVIKIEATDLPTLQFADSDAVKVGQMVCSIGVPFDLDYSFAFGWVSGKGRTGLTRTAFEDYIQTDSFVNPGDSGGPVLDINGKVIGMNTLINGIGRKMTFAIPSNMIQDVGNQLLSSGKIVRSWLGIGIYTLGEDSPLNDNDNQPVKGIDRGVVVSKIEAGAPAFKSELRVMDVITQVDGKEVVTAHDLQKEIVRKKVGQNVDLTVWRDGKSIKVAVVTGELPDMTKVSNAAPKVPKKEATPDAGKDNGGYGVKVQDLNKDLADKLKLKDAQGVVVTDVAEGSPASAAGVQKDDLITEVDSQPVQDTESFKTLLDNHDSDKGVLFFINRKGQKTYAILKAD